MRQKTRLSRWSQVAAAYFVALTAVGYFLRDPAWLALLGPFAFLLLFWWERATWRPRGHIGWANVVSFARVALIAAAASLVPYQETSWIWPLVILAFLALDGIDGQLARRLGEADALGSLFDMEADAFAVLLLGLVLTTSGRLVPWVLTAGLLRPALVLTRMMLGPDAPEGRSRFGRAVYVLHVTAIALCLATPHELATTLMVLSIAALVASFSTDFLPLFRRTPTRPISP